jgi:hypothetical protein
MTQEEVFENIEKHSKKLKDYNIQIELLNNQDDLTSDENQSKLNYLMTQITEATEDIENLISKL